MKISRNILSSMGFVIVLIAVFSMCITYGIHQYYLEKRTHIEIVNSDSMRSFSDLSWRIGDYASEAAVSSTTGYQYNAMKRVPELLNVSFDWRNSLGQLQHVQMLIQQSSSYDGFRFVLSDDMVLIYGERYSKQGTDAMLLTKLPSQQQK